MGLLDDLMGIVNEADALRQEIVGEFTDIGRDVKESIDDISTEAKDTKDEVSKHVKKKLTIDGVRRSSSDDD